MKFKKVPQMVRDILDQPERILRVSVSFIESLKQYAKELGIKLIDEDGIFELDEKTLLLDETLDGGYAIL